LQDELRNVIEKKVIVDESNIKTIVNNIYERLPQQMPRPFFEKFFPIRNKVENSFMDSYFKNHNVTYVKSCYINQYQKGIASHYYDETYKVIYFNPKYTTTRIKLLTYQVWEQQ